MSTTTIRLPDELKARVARAAERAGTTAHNFILEAIAEKTEAEERRSEFHALADRRYAEVLETGMTIPWDEARRYLLDLVQGKPAKRPVARKLKP
jgi:predicted transcriptional regulator